MITKSHHRCFLVFILLVFVAAITGCSAIPDEREKPFAYDFREPISYDNRHVIVFFIDGLNRDTFNRLLAEGRLPNIKEYFVDRGVTVDNAVTGVPSVTYAAMATFMTGLGPGHNGVPSLEWFDRDRLEYRWYTSPKRKYLIDDDYVGPNLYEVLHDQFTVTILNQLTRGATQYIENWYTVGPAYFFGFYNLVDRLSIVRFEEVNRLARTRGQYPRFIIAHIPGSDSTAHKSGSDGPRYIDSLLHADAQLGRLLANMKNQGVLDRLCIVLISDHGHMPTPPKNGVDLVRFLKKETGLKVAGRVNNWGKSPLQRAEQYEPFNLVVSHCGERTAFVYVRKPESATGDRMAPWRLAPDYQTLKNYPTPKGHTVNLVDLLAKLDAVHLAAYRESENTVRLAARDGEGLIRRRISDGKKTYSYQMIQGGDPLAYQNDQSAKGLLGDSFHDAATWLKATCKSDHPDAVVGLMEMFNSPRCGDIALFAAPGCQFSKTNKSGHGGLDRRDMLVPFIIAGPGIRHGTIETARTVDLFPTILDYLGYANRMKALTPRDGRSLLLEIKNQQ